MRKFTIRPEGVEVSRASLADTSHWTHVGTTPFDSVLVPAQLGMFRLTRPGYVTRYFVSSGYQPPMVLDSAGAPDSEMTTIAGDSAYGTFLVGTDGSKRLRLRDWKMDRYETSNREYKAFVEAGGYRDSTWWAEPFRDDGRTLHRAEAMARFVDQTGRPGPATWVGGDYPAGQGDMPVGGVSWYEAAAYAKWKGKSLPTIYHWSTAAGVFFSRGVVPESNMEGTGPWPVGKPRAVSLSGISDMAGNVREWNQNEAGRGLRFILGGGWSDPTYSYVDAYAQPPMDRSVINGIRLARYDPADSNVAVAVRPIPRAYTDWFKGLRYRTRLSRVSGASSTTTRVRSTPRWSGPTRPARNGGRRTSASPRRTGTSVCRRGCSFPARHAAVSDRGLLPRLGGDRHPYQRRAS